MATTAKMTIYVTSTRGNSRIRLVFNGKYVSFPVNAPAFDLKGQPLMTTSTQGAFWRQVLGIATSSVDTLP